MIDPVLRARRFAGGATLAAVLGLAVLLASGQPAEGIPWAVSGWAVLSLLGIGCGTWLALEHGRPGGRFLAALGAGMLGRLLAVGLGCILAAAQSGTALSSYATGLGAGFIPVQLFEAIYFYRATRGFGLRTRPTGAPER